MAKGKVRKAKRKGVTENDKTPKDIDTEDVPMKTADDIAVKDNVSAETTETAITDDDPMENSDVNKKNVDGTVPITEATVNSEKVCEEIRKENETANKCMNEAENKTINAAATESLNEAATESLNEAATESLNEAATESLNEAATESLNEAATESLNEAATESLNEAATESLKEAATELLDEAASESVNEVVDGSVNEVVDDNEVEQDTELNDSVAIICETDTSKDECLDISSASSELEEGELDSKTIDNPDSAIVMVPTDERTVEDGEGWNVETKLESFITWCNHKGLTLSPKVQVTSAGTCHRYGMIAADNIKKGETLFTVPRSLTLNPDNSRIVAEIVDYEDWLDSIGQSLDDSSGWATLLIALMLEFNDNDSFWAPYLRLVPKAEEYGHPLFWTKEEHREELKGTTLLYDIQRDVYNIESEYKQFVLPFIYRYKDVCGRRERYNLALYKRLVAFVMAYSFTEDFDSQPCMVPMADMLNHSSNNNAHLVFEEETLKMVALKKIEKGQEIFNTFGKLGNAELLQMYGYADTEPNIYDTLPILVNTFLDAMEKAEKVSDSFFQAKVSLLNKTEIAPADDFFLFDRNGMRKGPDLVQMLKILFMGEEEFEELLKSRAGNRPDSFYQKLLRKLKLAKKTDTSSGVVCIDITDEEPEMEPPPKRKIVDLQEIEDNDEPLPKQGRADMRSMYLQLAQSNPEHAFPINMLQQQFPTYNANPEIGNTISEAILIDDSDDESKTGEEEPKAVNTDNSASIDDEKSKDSVDLEKLKDTVDKEKKDSLNSESVKNKNDLNAHDRSLSEKDTDKVKDHEIPVNGLLSEGKESNDDIHNEKNSAEDTTSSTLNNDTPSNLDKVGDKKEDKVKNTSEETQSIKDTINKDEKKEDEGKSKPNKKDESDHGTKIKESKGTPVEKKVNGDISDDVLSIGDDLEDDINEADNDDTDSNDSDMDDILFVSEDIRCKVTYENLMKDLKSEWKEFIKSTLTTQIDSLKCDEEMTTKQAQEKMSGRQFYSYQIRQGQRSIVKTFLAALT